MKGLRILIIAVTAFLIAIALLSCTAEEVGNKTNNTSQCNCIKEYYEIEFTIYNGKTFVEHVLTDSEPVICQPEKGQTEITGVTYYKIVCE